MHTLTIVGISYLFQSGKGERETSKAREIIISTCTQTNVTALPCKQLIFVLQTRSAELFRFDCSLENEAIPLIFHLTPHARILRKSPSKRENQLLWEQEYITWIAAHLVVTKWSAYWILNSKPASLRPVFKPWQTGLPGELFIELTPYILFWKANTRFWINIQLTCTKCSNVSRTMELTSAASAPSTCAFTSTSGRSLQETNNSVKINPIRSKIYRLLRKVRSTINDLLWSTLKH